MKILKKTFGLLRRYHRVGSVLFSLLLVALVFTASFFFEEPDPRFFHAGALVFLVIFLWEVSEVHLLANRDDALEKLADKTDENILLSGRIRQLEDDVRVYKALSRGKKENPIRSNRVVSDKTFAVRLRSFVKDIQTCDAAGEEEKEYILKTAERLLEWQVKTVRKDTTEYDYLCSLGLVGEGDPETAKEVTVKNENENKD